ncbi:MAG: BMP family ABC transporter substrate-binding protein [Actinomycetota bacterium]|nr:BMP family ABC transporter substrate-binding protein [Actinomycetota bacterium]
MTSSSGRNVRRWAAGLLAFALIGAACSGDDDAVDATTAAPGDTPATTAATPDEPLIFGMVLVGPQNDHGWSQAHFEAGEYLQEQLGAEMLVVDLVNPADKPETTVEAVIADMIAQGAQLIFATSDDMKDGVQLAAEANPEIPMIWSSGDSAWVDGEAYRGDLTNLGNIMGRMELGKMIAGCAAALTTETGQIGYLGPLINDETRRLVASAYLGASRCWEDQGNDPADLEFTVTWIGFWFQIPGVTLDPTQVVNEFYDGGVDVVLSGIDTTEAIVRGGQRAAAGENVYAIPYDFEGACAEAEDICLGVPYFNWGPSYLEIANSVIDGSFSADFQWLGPDWADINNRDTSAIGWINGVGLAADDAATLDTFIAGLADGSIDLFTGPLNFQDGSPFLADGEVATDQQVWYLDQLLEGIEGASSS